MPKSELPTRAKELAKPSLRVAREERDAYLLHYQRWEAIVADLEGREPSEPPPDSSRRPGGPLEFAGKKPADAIRLFLQRKKRPQTERAIVNALAKGGALIGKTKTKGKKGDAASDLKRALEPMLTRYRSLQSINGLIGLPDWPKEMFK